MVASLLWNTGSRCTGFEVAVHKVSGCGTWALLFHSRWDLPGPGIKPVSLVLQGRFLNTGPPGKP